MTHYTRLPLETIRDVLGSRFDSVTGDGGLALRELALPPGAAVLDVGTGKGNFAIFLASQGCQVTTGEPATDTSHYAGQDWAANAKRAGVEDRIRFQHFDAARMPFAESSFDAVFFFGVFHHIDEAQRDQVLREALRVARPGGAVVLFEPNPGMLDRIHVDDPGHPPAADPSSCPSGAGAALRRIPGAWMDIFLYRKP